MDTIQFRPTVSIPVREPLNKKLLLNIFIIMLIISPDVYFLISQQSCINIQVVSIKISLFEWIITCIGIEATYAFIMIASILFRIKKIKPYYTLVLTIFLSWTVVGGFITWYYRESEGRCETGVIYMYLHILWNMIFLIFNTGYVKNLE